MSRSKGAEKQGIKRGEWAYAKGEKSVCAKR